MVRVNLPEPKGDIAAETKDDRCDSSRAVPRILPPSEINAQEEEHSSSYEEKDACIVKFGKQLHLGLPIVAVFHLEVRGAVEDPEEDKGDDMPREHIPVSTPPTDVVEGDEAICDGRATKRYSEGDIEET